MTETQAYLAHMLERTRAALQPLVPPVPKLKQAVPAVPVEGAAGPAAGEASGQLWQEARADAPPLELL